MDKKEKISKKLRSLKKYVDFLKSYQSIPKQTLEQNYELKSAIERNFQLALESALDIGEILISAENFEKPEDYKSVILILGKNKVLPKEFADHFADAASFRNILVHMYEEVDIEKLFEFLHYNLDDFNKFAKYIANYLEGINNNKWD